MYSSKNNHDMIGVSTLRYIFEKVKVIGVLPVKLNAQMPHTNTLTAYHVTFE